MHFFLMRNYQCFGSGLDPDSISSVGPNPDPNPGEQSTKLEKRNFMFDVLDVLDG
jgi:hypothetical protein